MHTVFIAGSRHITTLEDNVKERINTMMTKNLKIIVGDASGADQLVQEFLFSSDYKNVEIFCMGGFCRNNVGNWPIRKIAGSYSKRDFSYYAIKDQAMVKEANYGLMLWDGKSSGTKRNILQLVQEKVPVVVYMHPSKSFHTVLQEKDLETLGLREFLGDNVSA